LYNVFLQYTYLRFRYKIIQRAVRQCHAGFESLQLSL
jgi:hypothetical protein